MPPLDELESILPRNMKMHEASLRTVHTDVIEVNEDTRAWPKLLNRESGEAENVRIHLETGQAETQKKCQGNPKVYNVILSYTEIISMLAKHVARTTEQVVAKKIPTLVAYPLHDILQRKNEKACKKFVRSIIASLSIFFSTCCIGKRWTRFLTKMAKYFDTTDSADKVGEKLVSTNGFNAPIPAFIQRRTSEAVAAECLEAKIRNTGKVAESGCRCKTRLANVGITSKPYGFCSKQFTVGHRWWRWSWQMSSRALPTLSSPSQTP